MRVGLRAVALGAVLITPLLAQAPPAPAGAPTVSPRSALADCDRLKADNLKLRATVLDLQRTLAQLQIERETARLETDRQALEATFRALLKPAAGDVFDWTSLTFTAPPATTPAGSKP